MLIAALAATLAAPLMGPVRPTRAAAPNGQEIAEGLPMRSFMSINYRVLK